MFKGVAILNYRSFNLVVVFDNRTVASGIGEVYPVLVLQPSSVDFGGFYSDIKRTDI